MSPESLMEHFHFLRPLWLLAIIPAIVIVYYFWQQKRHAANWQGAISEQLLSHLVDGKTSPSQRWPWLILLTVWIVASIAMAGPTWKKLPQPVMQREDALIIIFDLSLSMYAEDVKPSRLIRARHKVLDILSQRKEGQTALIAYSGDAHIVSPLTDDNATIANLAPALAPSMMPAFGSDPVTAVQLAKQLFNNAGINSGRLLLITDGISQRDSIHISNELNNTNIDLSILGVGTTDGAPIPTQEGFLKDQSGNIIVPQLDQRPLKQLVKKNNGRYTDVSLNDDDVKFLLPTVLADITESTVLSEREFDQWDDSGYVLVLILLPFGLLAFRRGWLLALPLLLVFQPQTSYAFDWDDLWQRPDQQAAQLLQQGNNKAAADTFKNPEWKAAANYRAENFEQAEQSLADVNSAGAHYNRGNALAKSGKLDEALEAYDKAIALQPAMEDALFNKQLLEQVKQKQEQQENSDKQGDEKNDDQSSEQSGEKSGEQSNRESDDGQQQSEQNTDSKNNADQEPEKNTSSQQNSDQNEPDPSTQAENENENENEKSQQSVEQNTGEQSEQENNSDQIQQAPSEQSEALDPEAMQKQQAMEQLLRQIPDDPAGLLRRKFNYEYRLRQQQGEAEREQPKW